ncbi:MAG: ribonucleotide-diphosphate reductase subunit beta [Candidatus Caenarcaniphilales bacterium]|nr:ribonucleotide-diphosphate reductase subunit beta [Candidatus Caenarcaniphilales bacterium]
MSNSINNQSRNEGDLMSPVLDDEKKALGPFELKDAKPSFAYRLYQQGCSNSWFPKEISLAQDKQEYETKLSDMEKHYIKYMLGFFCTAESLVANNITHALYKHINNPEYKLYLLRQAYEEANHTVTFLYIIDSLGLDRQEIFDMFKTIPEIGAKASFEEQFTTDIMSKQEISERELFKNLFGFYAIMEGLYFFSGFLIGLSFGRRQLLKGIASLFQYILRDETVHLGFGMQAMRQMIKDNPNLITDDLQAELVAIMKQAVELESNYAEVAMPEGILGLNKNYYLQYCQYIADRRMGALKMDPIYRVANPAPWLATQTDLPELVSFFEATPTSYESRV